MIRELSENVRSKIAAGEVIERPVSVVKELVENAIDAHANDIRVSVINGGLDEIIVIDNGSGIAFDELPMAVKRFATSKIASEEDLDNILTLGFRGEALASIGDVADLTIFSSDGNSSGEIQVRGGNILFHKQTASPKGTRVVVRDLFFNLPARRKFLRSSSTEFSQIQKMLQSFVLLYPQISWTFTNEKGMVWHVTPNMADEERFYSLFGQKATMRSVSTDHGTLSAYVNPSVAGELILAVNGRLIKGSAYYQVLRIIRQLWNGASLPVIVLSLLVDPSDIDANVHPQKLDIRFRSYGWLNQVVDELIKSLFSAGNTAYNEADSFERKPFDFIESRNVSVEDPHADYDLLFSMDFNGVSTSAGKTFEIKDYLYDTFILVKRNGTYELWDQHAVNEKINYWRLSSLYGVQYLLEPLFSNIEEETSVALEEMGFDLQKVRGGYLIKAVPTLLLLSRSLDTIISDVQSVKGNIEKVRADLACRSSVKAGQKLTVMEMEALISEGLKVLDINYDPHGRPAIVSLDEQLIRRLFNR